MESENENSGQEAHDLHTAQETWLKGFPGDGPPGYVSPFPI